MARYTGPKNKLSRRAGTDLFSKGSKLRRLNIPPGVHGPKGSARRPSEFQQQLREKQKVKHLYGVLERQFRNYFQKASKEKANTAKVLLQLLERRLDNTVFRLGFTTTRAMARQLVTHGHVLVDSKKVDRPSFQVKPDQVITLIQPTLELVDIRKSLDSRPPLPSWLESKGPVGRVTGNPQPKDIDATIDERLIIEYYSR
jgi:small subunit ribosomal protein S4